MARPKKTNAERRDYPRLVRFTEAEDQALLERASSAGMNVSDFLRESALCRYFHPRPPLAEAKFLLYLRGEVGRVGTVIQQLAEELNRNNTSAVVNQIRTAIDQLQEVNKEVLRLLRHGHTREKQG